MLQALASALNQKLIKIKSQIEETGRERLWMTYGPGSSFGEHINISQTRQGTCIASEDTICGLIHRDQYLSVLDRLKQEETNKIQQFLQQIDWMQRWSNKELQQLIYMLRLQHVPRGKVLLKEGAQCDSVIFVKSGLFEVIRTDFSTMYQNQISGILEFKLENQTLRSNPVH